MAGIAGRPATNTASSKSIVDNVKHIPRAMVLITVGIIIAKVVVQFVDRYNALSGQTVQQIPSVVKDLVSTQGVALACIHSITAVLALSCSALFQVLCLGFILWKRWSTLRSFAWHLVSDPRATDSLGLF